LPSKSHNQGILAGVWHPFSTPPLFHPLNFFGIALNQPLNFFHGEFLDLSRFFLKLKISPFPIKLDYLSAVFKRCALQIDIAVITLGRRTLNREQITIMPAGYEMTTLQKFDVITLSAGYTKAPVFTAGSIKAMLHPAPL